MLTIFTIITSNEVCNYHNDCTCSFCGEGSNNYASCDYINLFCEEGTNILTNKFTNYKNRYLNTFKTERDAETYCGTQKSAIKEDKKETVIIKTGNSYTQGSKIHCHYKVIYNSFWNSYKDYNPLMTYEISGEGDNKIKFNLIVIYHSSTEDSTDIFTDDELRNNPYHDNVSEYDTVELFLDFKENDYSHYDEVFSVKVKLDLKGAGTQGTQETKEEEDDSWLSGGGIGGIIGGVAAIGIIIGVIACCCSREKTYEVREKSSCMIF